MKTVKRAQSSSVQKKVKKIQSKTPAVRVARSAAVKKTSTIGKTNVRVSPSKNAVDVVEMGSNSFIIVVNGARNFFEREEMRSLVRICHLASSESDAANRLYAWFSGKRKDVLIDTRVYDPHDLALKAMYRRLVSSYSVAQ